MTDLTKFNGWTLKIITSKAKIDKKAKMLEICINKKGSVEHINGLPKDYGYYVKRIK